MKKTGTDQYIPRIKQGFANTMLEKYGVSYEESDVLVENFLQVIHDASEYLFSLNHAVVYSYIGYACGYLRYYHTIEFITASLNNIMNKSTENIPEKTASIIEYGISKGITFHDIKFGYSRALYALDKETNSIYKGVGQVKYLNETVAEELYELSKRQFDSVFDLFFAVVEETGCNSKQMEILIKLNFFSDFGKDKYLLSLWQLINKRYKKTHKDKTKLARIEEIKGTEIPNEQFSISEKILFQLEFQDYSSIVVPSIPSNVAMVIAISDQYANRWVTLYRPHDGTTDMVKLSYNLIEKYGIKKGTKIRCDEVTHKNKTRLVEGKWMKLDQKEPHLTKLTIIE